MKDKGQGSKSRLKETDTCERREKERMGGKSLGLQYSSKKVSARPVGNPRQRLPIGEVLLQPKWGDTNIEADQK